ncbi:MAG: GNAT family N-acetyltransferase [Oscillospiraceae bacterium]|jgi:predicted acetyltransferase|nr:GNAT family N-acetyltransferase [Oscillospiraceae bacterium]
MGFRNFIQSYHAKQTGEWSANAMISIHMCTESDIPVLAQLNRMLIEDEKADNNMTISDLEQRMTDFLSSEYKAFFFEADERRIGYALINTAKNPFYLRQFFIGRKNRRMGYGKEAFHALLKHMKVSTIDLDVYAWNHRGISFWKSLGFSERYYNMRFEE